MTALASTRRAAQTHPRVAAARALAQVLGAHCSLSDVLPKALDSVAPDERGLTQELCYGVLRWQPALAHLATRLLTRPLRAGEHEVQALIYIGLYQLLYLRLPDYAAVATTVAAARQLHKPWAVGLVNAILRGFARRRAGLLADLEQDRVASTAHPDWLLRRLQSDWPQHWRAIVAANNIHPPLCLRVNLLRTTRADYCARLAAAGLSARPAPYTSAGLLLETPCAIERLPGFSAGLVSVQDGAAQLAAQCLDAQPGQRVLDACAAPGGKACHLLERTPTIMLTALDQDAERLGRVRHNLDRLGLSARLLAADASTPATWWDHQTFDRILLDAPCSASGVIRRHPDIKLLRRDTDIDALAARQRDLLGALWPLLKPGGRLLYATCSISRRENTLNIADFLDAQRDAEELPLSADWGLADRHGRQILPGMADMDGFYYACLVKTSAP